jgi:hypothetical protein
MRRENTMVLWEGTAEPAPEWAVRYQRLAQRATAGVCHESCRREYEETIRSLQKRQEGYELIIAAGAALFTGLLAWILAGVL